MKSIIVDMDNVMANVSQHYIRWYEKETGIKIDPTTLIGKPEVEGFPDPDLVRNFLYTPGFFRTVPLMEDCREVMYELTKRFEVFIVSAALEFPQSLNEKFDWLGEHFPFISWKQIVFCGSKSVIKGDYMIDDYPRNMEFFNGEKLLFTAPHNQLLQWPRRLNTWKEIAVHFSA